MAGTLSQNGYEFLKSLEGFRLKPYKASKSERYWTVGLGHYGADVNPNKIYTEAECMALFAKDKLRFEADVNKVWHEPMTQNMFDALFSMAYNHGNVSTTPLKALCAGNNYQNQNKIASAWINLYTVKGLLTNRRKKEVSLFYSNQINTEAFKSDYPLPNGGGYGGGGFSNQDPTQNNYTTYTSDLNGQKLNTDLSASLRMENADSEQVQHTRIYKMNEPTVVVDELSMALNIPSTEEKDSSTSN